MRITLPAAVMFVGLLTPLASGADRRIQVEPGATRSTLTGLLLGKPRKAEIQLKDGSKFSGILNAADVVGLQFWVKKGAAPGDRAVPYEQLSTVRVDLGPHRGWEGAGAALGFVGGLTVALVLNYHGRGGMAALPLLIIGSPILGGKLLGDRHREWLMIEVR